MIRIRKPTDVYELMEWVGQASLLVMAMVVWIMFGGLLIVWLWVG